MSTVPLGLVVLARPAARDEDHGGADGEVAVTGHDYVIVGAGSAGCVMAGRLSEDPQASVLLIEAGPRDNKMEVHIPAGFPKLFKTERDWDYHTEGQEHLDGRELYWPRGKMLGGCSSINAQMYVRGNRADFDEWAELGNDGWSWSEVLPYFRKAEHRTGAGNPTYGDRGPQYVEPLRDPSPLIRAAMRAAVEAGLTEIDDVNGQTQEGVAPTSVTQHRGRRWSTADAYLRGVRRRANLTVRTDAHATRLLVADGKVTGVELSSSGTVERVEARREVIVSAGAVNSPQLLMLSGIGPADALAAAGIDVVHELPGVGANLHDHLAVPAIFTTGGSATLLDAEKPQQLVRFLLTRKGMLTSNVGEAMAFIRTADDLPAPDVQLIFAPVEYIDHGLAPPPGHGITIGAVLLRPGSRGTITLASSDPFAAPIIEPNYLTDPADLPPLVAGLRLAREIAEQPALKPIVDGEMWPGTERVTDAEIGAFVREQAFTLYHPVGTCRMGNDDMAVVDARLRVRGVDNLRVVDASVMPVITRGNTNAPTIMLAEKAADLVRAPSLA
jgi:choline dehydrogenase